MVALGSALKAVAKQLNKKEKLAQHRAFVNTDTSISRVAKIIKKKNEQEQQRKQKEQKIFEKKIDNPRGDGSVNHGSRKESPRTTAEAFKNYYKMAKDHFSFVTPKD